MCEGRNKVPDTSGHPTNRSSMEAAHGDLDEVAKALLHRGQTGEFGLKVLVNDGVITVIRPYTETRRQIRATGD